MHVQIHPQVQATRNVSDFVYYEDHPRHLLIVYYAGHGAEHDGKLLLAGRLTHTEAGPDVYINWADIEVILGKTEADVLVIFDCCCAGILCRPVFGGGLRRKFQYIAACKSDELTPAAGPRSFTSAMIRALQNMAGEPGFTTRRLVRKLMQHEHFPSGQEAIVFGSRFGHVDGDIWLAASAQHVDARARSRETISTADVLDLRFHFAERATEDDIEQTARSLKSLLRDQGAVRFHAISILDDAAYAERADRGAIDVSQGQSEQREADAVAEVITLPTTGQTIGEIKDIRVVRTLLGGLELLVRAFRPVPAWHGTAYLVA